MKNFLGEECYVYHLPEHRCGREYLFEENYQRLTPTASEYKDTLSTDKEYMNSSVGEKFIKWIADIGEQEERKVSEFKDTLSGAQAEHFEKSFDNPLDPVTYMYEFHFNCNSYTKKGHQVMIKHCRMPEYIFDLNNIPTPVWK